MARPRKNIAASRASLLPESAPLPEIPVQEQPYPLPEGWKWVRLGDVLYLQAGKNINARNIQPKKSIEFPYPCFGGNGIRGYVKIHNYDGYYPLIGRQGALCGNVHFVSGKFYATEHAVLVSEKIPLNIVFSFYCLRNMNLNQYATATAQPGLAVSKLNELPFPLPPREEQERIVGHIESLFARLDEARQKAKAVRDSVTLRRAAILHKAFTGELTAKWREEQGISKESWEEKKLGSLATLQTGLMKGRKVSSPSVYKPYLRVANVQDGYFNLAEIKQIEVEESRITRWILQKGDVLLTEGGDFDKLGRGAVWEDQIPDCLHQNHIFAVRVNKDFLDPYFLSYQTRSKYGKEYFIACSKQTTNLASINSKQLKNFPVILPTPPEQQEIVRILDVLLGREQRLREAADAVVAHIERMKKAILARAFRGELGRADCPSRP